MAKGISINVGINKVTSTVFSAPELHGCENDARDMYQIALDQGFDAGLSSLLLGGDATFDKVVSAVRTAALNLVAGDLFLFSFAGHGTSKTVPPGSEEIDNHDESIVLADHLLIDNFWRNDLWPRFKPGVRSVAVADCCHAGTALVALKAGSHLSNEPEALGFGGNVAELSLNAFGFSGGIEAMPVVEELNEPVTRQISEEAREQEITHFKKFYKKQLNVAAQPIVTTRLFLSACNDNEEAADGEEHGAFTKALLDVWDQGGFKGSYKELMEAIQQQFVNTAQTPSLTQIGDPDFSSEAAFTIPNTL